MAFWIRDYHKKETGESRIVRCHAASSDAIMTLGIIKLLLYYVYEV